MRIFFMRGPFEVDCDFCGFFQAALHPKSQLACPSRTSGWARSLLVLQPEQTMKTRTTFPPHTAKRPEPKDDGVRLPYEHDESSDEPAGAPHRVMKAAHRDVATGKTDTDDRGTKATRAFNNAFRTPAASQKKKARVPAGTQKRKRPRP
jgi:hypothetical protein